MPLSCTDPDGDTLTLSKVADPTKGTLGAITGGWVTYTPNAGEFGADTFTFKASDGDGDSAAATARSGLSGPDVLDVSGRPRSAPRSRCR